MSATSAWDPQQDPQPGDWVVVASGGTIGPLVARLMSTHPVIPDTWLLDREWPTIPSTVCPARCIKRPATTDEIAAACMAGPEGTP